MNQIAVRLGLQQRVLAGYRAPFFDALGAVCANGLAVFAGQPRPSESIEPCKSLQHARLVSAKNVHIFAGRAYLCWQTGLLRWLEGWQPEVLILEANPRYLRSPAAAAWMHRRGRKVIGWGLGGAAVNGLRLAWRKNFLSHFDAMLTYSRQGFEDYAKMGFPESRIFIAPNAVTPRPQSPPPERPASFQSGRPTLLFVGRLQARKRVDLLLRACAELPPQRQPLLHIVGDGPERTRLEALAREVYPPTRFFGALYGSDLDPLFSAADLFVLPGTGGLAVQQAMSYALPVAVAEADGTQADLVRPENGWRIPPGDVQALTAMLNAALADPSALRRMGSASYRIISQEINLEAMLAAFQQAVASVQEKG